MHRQTVCPMARGPAADSGLSVGALCYTQCKDVRPWDFWPVTPAPHRRIKWPRGGCLPLRVPGHTCCMTALVIVALAMVLWCVAPIPVAVVVGRAFRAGEIETAFDEIVRDYDAAGV